CCIKHFPGHGDTSVDSHFDLPVVDKLRERLDCLELLPFRELQSDAPAIMTAHIVYSCLDAERAATLSRAVLTGLLRRELGYHGVIITDSLVMKAIHDRYGHDRAAVMALSAGADMVMAIGSEEEQVAAMSAIETALSRGELQRSALIEARARLDRLAARFPAKPVEYAAEARLADAALMRRAWAAGMTVLDEAKPPALDRPLRVVTQRRVSGDGVSESGLSGHRVAALFAQFAAAELVQVEDLLRTDAW